MAALLRLASMPLPEFRQRLAAAAAEAQRVAAGEPGAADAEGSPGGQAAGGSALPEQALRQLASGGAAPLHYELPAALQQQLQGPGQEREPAQPSGSPGGSSSGGSPGSSPGSPGGSSSSAARQRFLHELEQLVADPAGLAECKRQLAEETPQLRVALAAAETLLPEGPLPVRAGTRGAGRRLGPRRCCGAGLAAGAPRVRLQPWAIGWQPSATEGTTCCAPASLTKRLCPTPLHPSHPTPPACYSRRRTTLCPGWTCRPVGKQSLRRCSRCLASTTGWSCCSCSRRAPSVSAGARGRREGGAAALQPGLRAGAGSSGALAGVLLRRRLGLACRAAQRAWGRAMPRRRPAQGLPAPRAAAHPSACMHLLHCPHPPTHICRPG